MYEKEIQKVRVAILKGLSASSKCMLNNKIKSNSLIAITRDDKVQVVPARNLFR
jgi:hypothetical protein